MKLAAVQFAPGFKEIARNTSRIVELATRAAMQGAKLIVFPELATTGYSFMGPEEAAPFAETIGDFSKGSQYSLLRVAETFNVAIVWGLVGKSGNGSLYNTQMYVDPNGRYESYFKINLWGNDFLWASEGRANPPIVHCEVTKKKVGLLICRDVRDKASDDWKNFYSPGDADIVAFSSNWGDGGFPAVSWVDFAKENRTVLVVANRYGQETCNNFGEGGVCVIEPKGKVHCQGLQWNQDCIVYAETP